MTAVMVGARSKEAAPWRKSRSMVSIQRMPSRYDALPSSARLFRNGGALPAGLLRAIDHVQGRRARRVRDAHVSRRRVRGPEPLSGQGRVVLQAHVEG